MIGSFAWSCFFCLCGTPTSVQSWSKRVCRGGVERVVGLVEFYVSLTDKSSTYVMREEIPRSWRAIQAIRLFTDMKIAKEALLPKQFTQSM